MLAKNVLLVTAPTHPGYFYGTKFWDFVLDYLVWYLPSSCLYFAVWSALLHHFGVQDVAPESPHVRQALGTDRQKTSDRIPLLSLIYWLLIYCSYSKRLFILRYAPTTYYTAISVLLKAF